MTEITQPPADRPFVTVARTRDQVAAADERVARAILPVRAAPEATLLARTGSAARRIAIAAVLLAAAFASLLACLVADL
jgi:hypothetical protein